MKNTQAGTQTGPGSFPPVARRRRSWVRWLLVGLVALLALAVWQVWAPATRYAITGAAYGARVACSCRFIGGRSLGDCQKDMEGPVAYVTLSENAAAHSVTASYPLLASQTATWRNGPGCQLQPWDKRITQP